MELLEEIKNYLDLTWEDEKGDQKLCGIIDRARQILRSYSGTEIEFTENTEERQLLFDLVRYIYNHAFEDFKTNFANELIMLRVKYKVKALEESSNEQAEDTSV